MAGTVHQQGRSGGRSAGGRADLAILCEGIALAAEWFLLCLRGRGRGTGRGICACAAVLEHLSQGSPSTGRGCYVEAQPVSSAVSYEVCDFSEPIPADGRGGNISCQALLQNYGGAATGHPSRGCRVP